MAIKHVVASTQLNISQAQTSFINDNIREVILRLVGKAAISSEVESWDVLSGFTGTAVVGFELMTTVITLMCFKSTVCHFWHFDFSVKRHYCFFHGDVVLWK